MCACALVCAPSGVRAESLLDAIQLAYASNPALRAQRDATRATDEAYVQARAGYGPQVSISGQVEYQAARVQSPASFFTPAGTASYGATTGSVDLTATQPIYTTGAARAQVRAAQANVFAQREALRQAESQTILNVVSAYMDVLRDRQTIKVLEDEIAILSEEEKEIQAKARLLVVSRTDVAEAEARLLSSKTQLLQAQGRLAASNAEYLDVVGADPGELAPPPDLPGMPATVDAAFEAADHNNPQLLGAIQSEKAARQQVDRAKSAYGPTVSLRADASIGPVEPYLPHQYDRSITGAIVFSQPIFTSGMLASKVREAADDDGRAALNVESARRGVTQLVAQAWSQLVSSRQAIALQQQQVTDEEAAARGNRIEERAGLRTTIDLLNAEQELASTQAGLIQSRHDEYVARAALLSAMGLLEIEQLDPAAQRYRPEAAFKRVEHAGASPVEGMVEFGDAIGAPTTAPPKDATEPTRRAAGLPPLPPPPG